MTNLEVVTMRRKELDRIIYFEKLKSKELTQREVSEIIDLSVRQIKRLYKKFKQHGAAGLTHASRGKISNRSINPAIEAQIIAILRNKLPDFKPTFATEKLRELYGITISHETIRKIMIKHELWEPKKRSVNVHVWRERKHHEGELLQMDGSRHRWFNDEYYTLIACIDDATGKMSARFFPEETIEGVSAVTKLYIEKYGRPKEIYTDRGGVYKVNLGKNKGITQFNRMLNELDIKLIFARSPQAKGRIERLFRTLQDRLLLELKHANITTMEAANAFLADGYIDKFNKQFSVAPKNATPVNRSIEGFDLKSIFCLKETRILKEDYTVIYKNRWFQLDKKQVVPIRKHQAITIAISFDKTIILLSKTHRLKFKEIAKQLPREKRRDVEKCKEYNVVKDGASNPSSSHPWRNRAFWQRKDDTSILHKR